MRTAGVPHRSVVVVAVGAVLAVGACSSPTGVSPRVELERVAAPASLSKVCTDTLCTGVRDGAPFEIQLPHHWNGTLLLWSHGYRAAAATPGNPLDPSSTQQPVRTAEVAASDEAAQELLSEGYALAGSANKANGWAVQDSVAANEDLYAYFSKTFGHPNRVYVWGASLGGLSTQVLAEKHPDWVAGSAPLCAPLAGTNLNLDLALDVAYGVKTLFDPSLKLTGFTSHDEAVASWEHAAKALVAAAKSGSPESIAGLLTLKDLAGAPDKTQDQDGSTTTSTGAAIVESVVNALGYATFGRYELEQRVGGNPSGNAGVDYGSRLSASDRALVNAAAPGKLDGILAKLAGGARVTPDPAARAKADGLGNPSGRIDVPTLTMHTIDDPLVLVANENVYGQRVDAAKVSGELAGFLTRPPVKYTSAPYGAGHCNFTTQEQVGVIDLLDQWVREGRYPASGAIAHELGYSTDGGQGSNTPATIDEGTATTGYAPSELPPAWPNPQAAIVP